MLLKVRPNRASQHQAALRLLRPDEAAPLARAAFQLRRLTSPSRCSTAGVVGHLLASRLSYWPDPDTADIWQSPATTLRDGGGDCEDLALAGAAALLRLGFRADLVLGELHQDGAWLGHAWVEGVDERGGFLLEATTGEVLRRRPLSYRVEFRAGYWKGRAARSAA